MTPGLFPVALWPLATAAPTYSPPGLGTVRAGNRELAVPPVTKDQPMPAPAANSSTDMSAFLTGPFQVTASFEAPKAVTWPYQIWRTCRSVPS